MPSSTISVPQSGAKLIWDLLHADPHSYSRTAEANLIALLRSMHGKAIHAYGGVYWLDATDQLCSRQLVSGFHAYLKVPETDQPQSPASDPESTPNSLLADAGSAELDSEA